MRRSPWIRTAAGVSAAAVALVALPACGGSTTQTTAAMPAGPGENGGMPGDPSTMLTQRLDALVSAGTITSAQEQTVVSALKAAMSGAFSGGQAGQTAPAPGATPPAQGAAPSPGATPPSQGGVPPGQGGASGAGGPGARLFSGALAELVTAGTITKAQSQAVLEALTAGGAPGPSASPTA